MVKYKIRLCDDGDNANLFSYFFHSCVPTMKWNYCEYSWIGVNDDKGKEIIVARRKQLVD